LYIILGLVVASEGYRLRVAVEVRGSTMVAFRNSCAQELQACKKQDLIETIVCLYSHSMSVECKENAEKMVHKSAVFAMAKAMSHVVRQVAESSSPAVESEVIPTEVIPTEVIPTESLRDESVHWQENGLMGAADSKGETENSEQPARRKPCARRMRHGGNRGHEEGSTEWNNEGQVEGSEGKHHHGKGHRHHDHHVNRHQEQYGSGHHGEQRHPGVHGHGLHRRSMKARCIMSHVVHGVMFIGMIALVVKGLRCCMRRMCSCCCTRSQNLQYPAQFPGHGQVVDEGRLDQPLLLTDEESAFVYGHK